MVFGKIFKKKMSKSDVADFLLTLEKEWASSWRSFFVSEMNLPDDEISESHAHMFALFVLTMAMPDNEVRDFIHDKFCQKLPYRNNFLQYLDTLYKKMHPVFISYNDNPGPAIGFTVYNIMNQSHGNEFSIPNGDIDTHATIMIMEQFKATLNTLKELKENFNIIGM